MKNYLQNHKHILYALYYPIFIIWFTLAERLVVDSYTIMYCPLDDYIPFCEWFVIPYVLWYFYMLATAVFFYFKDPEMFKKFLLTIAIGYSACLIIYTLFPNGQDLRPTHFQNDNILTRIMAMLYANDTNTNVFPSIHVLGSCITAYAIAVCEKLRDKRFLQIVNWTLCISICMSTVFVKQHSALDVFGALPLSVVVCAAVYHGFKKKAPVPQY